MKRRPQQLPITSMGRNDMRSTTARLHTANQNNRFRIFTVILFISFVFIGLKYKKEGDEIEESLRSTVGNLQEEIRVKTKQEDETQKRYSDLVSTNTRIEDEKKTLAEKMSKREAQLAELEDLKKINAAHDKEFTIFRKALNVVCTKTVLQKFGDPPYRVEFQLEFPPEETPAGTGDRFVIEMAPLDLMPYTVYFFMQQISYKLYDGCAFHRNAGHVAQVGAVSYFANKGTNVAKPFKEADLNSVSFQEYHPDFPHSKYTLGYAGRPGGPDFYVSVVDNTINHGPGGQENYKKQAEADPCFAKVIEGFDAVDRLHQMEVEKGDYKRMKNYVGIKEARILNVVEEKGEEKGENKELVDGYVSFKA